MHDMDVHTADSNNYLLSQFHSAIPLPDDFDISTEYLNIDDLEFSPFFTSQIFNTIQDVGSLIACYIECQNVGTTCSFFVYEDTSCHLGDNTISTGSATLQWTTGWNLHYKQDQVSAYVVSETGHTISSELSSNWCYYVYKVMVFTHECLLSFNKLMNFNSFNSEVFLNFAI